MKQLGFLLALGLCAISGTAAAACDAAAGQKLFESKCTACHSLAEHKVGPRLHDVYGRKVGTAQGFGYTPTLEQAGFTWNAEKLDAFLSGPMRYRPVHQVMKDAGIKMETLRAPAMMTPTPLDAANRLNALPVGLATPVMFYNKQAFKEAGLDTENAPPTWQALQGALGKLVAAGQSCPYTTAQPAWILVENTSAWHNEPVVAESKKTTSLAINGMLEVKHVAMLSSWVKARYLHLFGREDEATERFAKGECGVLTAPSAAWPTLKRQAAFILFYRGRKE